MSDVTRSWQDSRLVGRASCAKSNIASSISDLPGNAAAQAGST